MFLKPVKGILVRTEDAARCIAAEGEDLPNSAYYRRRMKDGDLVDAEKPKPSPATDKDHKEK